MRSLSREGSALLFSYLIYVYIYKRKIHFRFYPFYLRSHQWEEGRGMRAYVRNRRAKFFFFFISTNENRTKTSNTRVEFFFEILCFLSLRRERDIRIRIQSYIVCSSNSSLFQYFSEIIERVYTKLKFPSFPPGSIFIHSDTRSQRSFRILFQDLSYFTVNLCR